jgi:membrane protease YdiL (CAAX protease family)
LAAGFLFGYLYHYTQNLYYTIFGHVLYNSIVIVANFYASRSSRFDFMKEDYSPSVIIVLISALAFVFVWSIFIKKNILVKGAGHE